MLIILEMANNHMGDMELGKRIIREHAEVTRKFPQFTYAFKFQYRDLGTFIHPSADPEHKYVKRFKETNLSEEDRITLRDYAKVRGFLVACTPFDEKSVEDVVRHGYDILKVGSPSFTDWPLWECIQRYWPGPVIASCGGATEEEIDRVVEMNPDRDLTLLHCISEYPSPHNVTLLGQMEWMKRKYPNIKTGYSSHEEYPSVGTLAIYCGAEAVERHVCCENKPNLYSVTPNEIEGEIRAWSSVVGKYKFKPWSEFHKKRYPGPKPIQFQRQMIDGRMYWKP